MELVFYLQLPTALVFEVKKFLHGVTGIIFLPTQSLNPMVPSSMIPVIGWTSTALEIVFGVCLIIGFKTSSITKLSGWLLLIFALAITFTRGIKSPLNYSVFAASAGAFGLGLIKEIFLEIDTLLNKNKK